MVISKIENEDFGRWTCNPELQKDGPAVAEAILLQKKEHTINIDFIILIVSALLGTITSLIIIFYIKYKNNKT